jgi:glutathione peroxidase
MNKKFLLPVLLLAFAGIFVYSFTEVEKSRAIQQNARSSFYDLKILSLDQKHSINFSDFKGKKVLCVNVASECGYTPQYTALQQLHEKYKDKLVLIGFPCNQFGAQEPGSAADIDSFCKKNYGVTFPLTRKIDVKGDQQDPVYAWLCKKALNGKSDAEVKWNFNKFLIDENGNWVAWFPSKVAPMSDTLQSLLQ